LTNKKQKLPPEIGFHHINRSSLYLFLFYKEIYTS